MSEACIPIFRSRRSRITPGASMGTRKTVKPSWPASGSVRVRSITMAARCPLVMKVFEPLITQPSPSRTARVLVPARSEPASGSVIARQNI